MSPLPTARGKLPLNHENMHLHQKGRLLSALSTSRKCPGPQPRLIIAAVGSSSPPFIQGLHAFFDPTEEASNLKQIDRNIMFDLFTCGKPPRLVLQKPSYHAKLLETLEPYLQPGARVLEVGSGSGYLTAGMALLVGESGKAVALDHIPELMYAMRKSVQQTPAQKLVDAGALSFVVGDGRAGAPEFAPYDVVVLLEYSSRVTLPVYTQVKEDGVLLTYVLNPGEIEFEQKLMRRRRAGELDEAGRIVGPGDCVFEALQVVHAGQEGYSPMLTKAAQRGFGFAYR